MKIILSALFFGLTFFLCCPICIGQRCGFRPDMQMLRDRAPESAVEQALFESFTQTIVNGQTLPPTYFPLKITVVCYLNGNGCADSTRIDRLIELTNRDYERTGIRFFRCGSIQYIQNDSLCCDDPCVIAQSPLFLQGYQDSVINLWITYQDPFDYGAYCHTPVSDIVLLSYPGVVEDHALAHELGHYFGLFHTHDEVNGPSLTDGTDCDKYGDLICDTPADPGLEHISTPGCTYYDFGAPTLDAAGMPYHPLMDNIMSYAPQGCLRRFTPQQLAKMAVRAATTRAYIKGCPDWKFDLQTSYTSACSPPFTVQFKANSPATEHFAWDFDNDGILDDSSANPVFTYQKPGDYSVSLWLKKGNQTIRVSKPGLVSIGPKPYPYFEDFQGFTDRFAAKTAVIIPPLSNGWLADTVFYNPQTYQDSPSSWASSTVPGRHSSFPSGPAYDHTLKSLSYGRVLLTVFDKDTSLDTIELLSPCLALPAVGSPKISFWYHLRSPHAGVLHTDLFDGVQWVNDIIAPVIGQQQADDTSAYKQLVMNVASYLGKSVRVRLRAQEIDASPDAYYLAVDDFLVWEHHSIAFITPGAKHYQITEEAITQTNGCRSWQTLRIPLCLRGAIADDTAFVRITTTGNAVAGTDYDLINNVLRLAPGTQDTTWLNLRIYDDQEVEFTDSLTLHLALDGQSNAWLTDSTVTIYMSGAERMVDNPTGNSAQVLLLNENFATVNLPVGWQTVSPTSSETGWQIKNYSWWIQKYGALDVQQGVPGSPTNRFALMIGEGDYAGNAADYLVTPPLDFSAYDRAVLDFDTYASQFSSSAYTVEYSIAGAQGPWTTLRQFSPTAAWMHTQTDISEVAGLTNVRLAFHFNSGGFRETWWVDNVKVRGLGATARPDTSLSHTGAYRLGPFEKIALIAKQDTDAMLVTLENESSHDFGCISVENVRSGTEAMPVYLPSGTRVATAARVLYIQSEYPDTLASVQLTLYYDASEIAGWQAGSGANSLILNILQSEIALVPNDTLHQYTWGENPLVFDYTQQHHTGIRARVRNLDGWHTVGTPAPLDALKEPVARPEFVVYPNPTNSTVQLMVSPELTQARYQLLDGLGRVILAGQLSTAVTTLDLGDRANGMYVLVLTTDKGVVGKLLIKD